jgi:PilZ domain
MRFSSYPFRNQKQNLKPLAPEEEVHGRRIVPRKPYTMPVRFVVLSEELALAGNFQGNARVMNELNSGLDRAIEPHQGETFDLSERGIGFKSQQPICLGQSIELFFTLPAELTGRIPEEVRCTAKVVHVDDRRDPRGLTCVGATIERFERLSPKRSN